MRTRRPRTALGLAARAWLGSAAIAEVLDARARFPKGATFVVPQDQAKYYGVAHIENGIAYASDGAIIGMLMRYEDSAD